MPLNPNGDVREHKEFILVQTNGALRPVRESEPVLPCTRKVLVVGVYKLAAREEQILGLGLESVRMSVFF